MPPLFYTPTAIVVGLICSYIGTLHCHLQIKNFTKTLEPLELSQYQNIKQRRLYYFITGFVIAIIGSILYLCLNKSNMYHRIINALVIFLLTPMIVYTLFPKSPYLLEQSRIDNQETRNWFKIYVCMKNGMIYGFCIGFIATLIVLAILQLVFR